LDDLDDYDWCRSAASSCGSHGSVCRGDTSEAIKLP
jgi:hypothetical protein